jgi:UDP-2-acetamido-3-amino-2,3-dideoxy-glucuronate N-acetyltransferase
VAETIGRQANGVTIHPSADVSGDADIGSGTTVWNNAQVREGARIGRECIIGKGAYVDRDVVVGERVKIENGAYLYRGTTVEDGVFIGPRATITNDRFPRAVNPDNSLKGAGDWEIGPVTVRSGASIGAGAILLPDVDIGRYAMVGAGAVVTRSVPAHGLVAGIPATLLGYACGCGHRMERVIASDDLYHCSVCGREYRLGIEA